MGKKLNEQERLQAVVDYAHCHNYSEVARKYGVSDNTIRRLVEDRSEFFENVEEEKEAAAEDVLTHMQKQLGKVNLIIDKYLDRLLEDDLLKKASTAQLTTSLGTLIDKYAMIAQHGRGGTVEDDPLTKALKEEAERMNNGDLS